MIGDISVCKACVVKFVVFLSSTFDLPCFSFIFKIMIVSHH